MNTEREVIKILEEVLGLEHGSERMRRDSPLLGAVRELDSMAVMAVITSIEDRFGICVEDDELNSAHFETVGALADFVSGKVTA